VQIAEQLRLRWSRWRLRIRGWSAVAAQYRRELDAEWMRWGLERARRDVRSLGCGRRDDRDESDTSGGSSGRNAVWWEFDMRDSDGRDRNLLHRHQKLSSEEVNSTG